MNSPADAGSYRFAGFTDTFYIVQPDPLRENRFKCGITADIGKRIAGYLTASPDARLVDLFAIPKGYEKPLITALVDGIGARISREVIDIDDLKAFYQRLSTLPYKRLIATRNSAMRGLIDRRRYKYDVPSVPTPGSPLF